MAKKKRRGSKSQAVRDYLTQDPTATASVVVAELAQRRIKVSRALVDQVKQRMKKSGDLGGSGEMVATKTTKKRGGGRTGAKKSVTGAGSRSNALTAEDLVAAKKLADELGGIDQARKALKYLDDLG